MSTGPPAKIVGEESPQRTETIPEGHQRHDGRVLPKGPFLGRSPRGEGEIIPPIT